MLKRLLLGVLVFVVLGGATAAWLLYSPKPPAPLVRAEAVTIAVDKHAQLPASGAAGSPPHSPVLLVLHASQSDGAHMRRIVGDTIERITAADHPLIVYPDGFEGHFNDCRRAASYSARTAGIDDIAFMRAIVDRLVTERQADPRRVFALGYERRTARRAAHARGARPARGCHRDQRQPADGRQPCLSHRGFAQPAARFIEGTSDRINCSTARTRHAVRFGSPRLGAPRARERQPGSRRRWGCCRRARSRSRRPPGSRPITRTGSAPRDA